MGLFTRHYRSLPPRLTWPSLCRRLWIYPVDAHLQGWGPQFLQLTNLQRLELQGDGYLFDRTDFTLPAEIGQLRTLKCLVLLNLPIEFPEWIADLPNLRYLVVRGTNLTTIPPWIDRLHSLHTLRIENCDLAVLPETLREMTNLRELGLSDTRLTDFSPAHFPPQLRTLNFAGTGCWRRSDLSQLQQALPRTKVHPDPNYPGWHGNAEQ